MRYNVEEMKPPQIDLGPIGLLIILLSTNVGITPPSGSNRSFRLVMCGLGTWVDY